MSEGIGESVVGVVMGVVWEVKRVRVELFGVVWCSVAGFFRGAKGLGG